VKCIKAETFSLVFSVRIGLSLCWVLVCARYLFGSLLGSFVAPVAGLGFTCRLVVASRTPSFGSVRVSLPDFSVRSGSRSSVKRAAYFAFQVFVFFGQWSGSALPSQGFRLRALVYIVINFPSLLVSRF
jgi:hypothetical protein